MFNWKKINSLSDLPREGTFLLWDKTCESGISVYEAMIFNDGTIGCPATCEKFNLKDFSHWCRIEVPEFNEKRTTNNANIGSKLVDPKDEMEFKIINSKLDYMINILNSTIS